eukprot:TRINITY_DN2428_c0_g1_i1.p2 TRINITY_DN2428_c0_g1~~TRINITY_DN2428_c0_g1_i1.p2  ORF type:complete len:124 (+),score=18.44 TRINITY_DN2428_c0_g1_i1:269-640(+)
MTLTSRRLQLIKNDCCALNDEHCKSTEAEHFCKFKHLYQIERKKFEYQRCLQKTLKTILDQLQPHGKDVGSWATVRETDKLLISTRKNKSGLFYGRYEGIIKAVPQKYWILSSILKIAAILIP